MSTQTIDTSGRRLTIGAVRERLMEEFPDISISKIRYLEGQGLLAPRRTQSGYRLYSDEDVERLRTILQLQRDEFLPLRVIRDELMSPGTKRRTRRRSSAGPLSATEPMIDLANAVRALGHRCGVRARAGGLRNPRAHGRGRGIPLSRARRRDRQPPAPGCSASASSRATSARSETERPRPPGSSSRSSRRRCARAIQSGAARGSRTSRRSRPRRRNSHSCSSGAHSGRSSE